MTDKWKDLEADIQDLDNHADTFETRTETTKLKLLLSIAKSLDSIYNHGIIAYDRA